MKSASWVRNPVDAFVLVRLEEKNLSPSPAADKRTLIRRVTFDLTGLPPTPEEIEAFLLDNRSDAYEHLVDRLLASPRYGERWGRHWLDVVRYADSHGFEMNQPRPSAWHYRDWVIRSLNEDKPYDRLVFEQIAGDSAGADAATGFLVAGPWDQVKSPDPVLTAQQRADELHDMVSAAGDTFLGLTIGCARCHDHKFDPIPQADYYRFAAVFAGVHHGERPLRRPDEAERQKQADAVREDLAALDAKLDASQPLALPTARDARPPVSPLRNVDRFEPTEAKFVRFTALATNQYEPCVDELEVYAAGEPVRNVALASAGAKATSSGDYPGNPIHKLEHVNDGRYGNGRSWISNEQGKGWVQVELVAPTRIDRIVWGRDREGTYRDRLATKYRIEVSSDGNAWRLVASSDDRSSTAPSGTPGVLAPPGLFAEKRSLEQKLKELTAQRLAYAGSFTTPGPTHVLRRGDPMQPLDPVAPAALSNVGTRLHLPPDAPEQQRRVALARWITDPSNPLTARVIVNRLWHYHFGRGIVATPSDFGKMGAPPTHPQLLDWLATQLVREYGWRLKPLHRLIVLSATYRQSGAARPHALVADADSTLLWRYPPRRLEAEAIRDAVLAVSGKLDFTSGGPGFDGFKPNDNYVRVYEPKDEFGPLEWRRMVYQSRPRSQLDGTFGPFDCPDAGQSAPKRNSSTTPLQALNLLNAPFMVQQSELFAERLKKEVGEDVNKQVERGFAHAFGRPPTESEREGAAKLVTEQGLPALCRALLNANEFVYVY